MTNQDSPNTSTSVQIPANLSNCQNKKKKISFIIRNEQEVSHRSAVSALQYDPNSGRLFTGGSDTIIRTWTVPQHKDAFSARGGVRTAGKSSSVQYQSSLEEHTDWINDMVLCENGTVLVSASNDTTVKVWDIRKDNKHQYRKCLNEHTDYVSTLASAPLAGKTLSASFDATIRIYDNNENFRPVTKYNFGKDSLYSLTTTPNMSLIVAGGSDKCIRFLDTRTNDKPIKLRGHTDNVRALLINDDGTRIISAGSDNTIRIWDVGQQLNVSTCTKHSAGIWTLQIDSSFTNVYSAGKDKMILKTPVSDFRGGSKLLFNEEAPVKKLLLSERDSPSSVWVGTWRSNINRWSLRSINHNSFGGDEEDPLTSSFNQCSSSKPFDSHSNGPKDLEPQQTDPELVIPGAAWINKHKTMHDKRHVLTQDTDGKIAKYDVLTAKQVEIDKVISFDLPPEISAKLFVPSWFTVDCKSGMLQITLDELDVFSAWLSTRDAGFTEDEDTKVDLVNYGGMMLRSLYENWPQNRLHGTEVVEGDDIMKTNTTTFFKIPPHTPFIVCEANGRPLYRTLVKNTSDEFVANQIAIVNPSWVVDAIERNQLPKFNKMPFYLLPHPSLNTKQPKKDRLSATEMLQIKKVMEHVYEKVMSGTVPVTGIHNRVHMFCNEHELPPEMDLRTVKHFYWKQSGELLLYYRTVR